MLWNVASSPNRTLQKNSGSCSTPNAHVKIVLAFCGRLRLIPAQELCDKDDID